MNCRTIFTALLLLLTTGTWAQSPQSIVCNSDGTVTFKYKNDQAKEVMVDVQFAGRKPMTKQADGIWTVTLGPVAKDMYPYCFIVDGVSVMDPENPQYFPNEGFKNCLLEIPGNGTLPHDIRDVPHGSVEYVHYYSKAIGATNNAVVYLPPSYRTDFQRQYPVFYLISGTTDTEEVYYKVGRVNYILDNLLADHRTKEMIVVMPYGNPMKLSTGKGAPADNNGQPATRFGGDPFSRDLIGDLMPFIEKNYRTMNNRDSRAIGGFSRGGNQALYNGLTNLDKFAYLCSYSSFTSTDIPDVYDNAAETNKKIRLFWLGVGTDDFLYGNARDYMEFLDQKGIRNVKEFTTDKYGHTWMNAKYFLAQTLPLLFNKKKSAEAMANAQPAPSKTGLEQQFTPGVMARLFPKPILSPEYSQDSIIFRMKAPDAQNVELECEILPDNLAMTKDADGIWSVTMTDFATETFKYCFIVDGTRVADPQNMLLSPDRGFKYSIADNPYGPFSFALMGDIPHGRTNYDLSRQEAWYMSPTTGQPSMPVMIQLVPGENDTMESWFKVGGADAIADRLLADGKTKPCILTTSNLEFMQQGGMRMPGFQTRVLRADDYPTWSQRRRALLRLLIKIGKEPAPSFPGFGGAPGGGFGGGFGGGGFGGGFGGGDGF
jgi:enterochelin esterase-like enzyme